MRFWCIRFADGGMGPPNPDRDAIAAIFGRIPDSRRELCRIVCLEEVSEANAETLRPAADPFSTSELETVGLQAASEIATEVREAYRAAIKEAAEMGAKLDAESARRARAQLPTLTDLRATQQGEKR